MWICFKNIETKNTFLPYKTIVTIMIMRCYIQNSWCIRFAAKIKKGENSTWPKYREKIFDPEEKDMLTCPIKKQIRMMSRDYSAPQFNSWVNCRYHCFEKQHILHIYCILGGN